MKRATKNKSSNNELALLNELSRLIEQSQQQAAIQVNSSFTLLFWHIDTQIKKISYKINGPVTVSKLS